MQNTHERILVADDEKYLVTSIKLWLKSHGYDAAAALNGEMALEKILESNTKDTSYDLLILDIQMPVMNGLELIDRLKRLHISIPVLVITGYGDRKLLMELLKRRCNDYLDKPFNEELLLSKVQLILKREKKLTS
ncbi:MAG: response regulator [bacterium]